MIINIRKPKLGDLNYLLDIDLKCFEDSLSLEEWKIFLNDTSCNVLVGTLKGAPVGLIVWKDSTILKLAVKPVYRHKGIGTKLLNSVENILIQHGYGQISIDVSESLCCPGKPIDVSSWLLSRKFKADKIYKETAIFCGQKEDTIHFVKLLSGTITHG